MKKTRNSFSGSMGFVLAAAGSAVGLGNIWRFPFLAARDGGGLFLLVYIILTVTFGFTLLITEVAIGRRAAQGPLTAYGYFHKKWKFLGMFSFIVPFIIYPYYCVIGGWVLNYLTTYATFNAQAPCADGYFGDFISSQWTPIIYMAVFAAACLYIVYNGVEKGIERYSRIIMPSLVVLVVGISLYSLTLSYTSESGVTRTGLQGAAVYLIPNFDGLTLRKFLMVVLDAMGQLFYSLSIAMGIMVAYGSYMKKDVNLGKAVDRIEICDTAIAILAGLMIIPAVYVFMGTEGMSAGPGLMFVTMPKVFASMHLGTLIGIVFFVLVFFAALTSCISLYETVVSILGDRFHMNRRNSCIVTYIICIVLGLLSAMGYGTLSGIQPLGMAFLDFFDFISNSVLMPIVALLSCLFLGWVVGIDYIAKEVKKNSSFRREPMFRVMIRWIAPIFLVAILVSSVLCALGIISI